MKCANCNKKLNNEIIAFCEKCEEIYCITCCKGHSHGLSFMRYENNQLTTIPIGVTGMGFPDNHEKFYIESDWVLRTSRCSHVEYKMNEGQPVFECEDGKIRCGDCFYNSQMATIRPLIKLNNDENRLIWLTPSNFNPFDLKFTFNCDSGGSKGQKIKANVKIENNKKNSIKDVNILIGAVAADPCPSNMSCERYLDDLYPYYLILKDLHHDFISSGETLDIDIKLYIPQDGEIKIHQFVEFYISDGSDNGYCENGLLNVPKNLMIYAYFTYKTFSDNVFISYIETDLVEVK